MDEERTLSTCETLIMKTIWDAGKDLSLMELSALLKERYQKDYARTTVATFLLKLSEKGFVRTYHKGRNSFIQAIKDEEAYKQRLLKEETDFWYQGSASRLVSALYQGKKMPKEEIEALRRMLDVFDGENR